MLSRLCSIALSLLSLTIAFPRKDSKIFGGRDCDVHRYPFYIYIEYYSNSSKFICGGSLLSIHSVLTAGHCCNDMTSGTAYSGYFRTSRTYDQSSPIIQPPTLHPEFNSSTLKNDVCIIKLEKPFKLTKKTRLVTLMPKKKLKEMMENDNEEKTYDLQLMGYGVNKRKSPIEFTIDDTKSFQCTNSILRTQKKCFELMKDPIEVQRYSKDTMFCHYNPEANSTKGSCEGDSGSPILYTNKQVGLISWGPNEEVCTEKEEISVRLDSVYDWAVKGGVKGMTFRSMGAINGGQITTLQRKFQIPRGK